MNFSARLRIVASLLFGCVVCVAIPTEARADNACTFDAIFTYAPGPTYGFTYAPGQEAIFSKVDNTMAATCGGGTSNWIAQTVNSSFNGSDYVEAGWIEASDNSLKFFSEQYKNGVDTFNFPVYLCSGQATGSGTFGFKVEHAAYGVWGSYADCTGGQSNWTQFGPWLSTGYGTAVPRGEFEKFDRSNTVNMFHSSTRYRSGSSWPSWPGVGCWGDTMPNYQMAPYGGSAWAIIAGNYSGSCANGTNTP